MKFKEKFKNFKVHFNKIFRSYPATSIYAIIFTIIISVLIFINYQNENISFKIGIVSIPLIAGSFLNESIFKKISKKNIIFRIILYILTIAISILSYYFVTTDEFRFNERLYLSFILFCLLIGIWKTIKYSNNSFSEYAIKAGINLIEAGIIIGLFCAGASIIYEIIVGLFNIEFSESYKYLIGVTTLIIGLIGTPMFLISINDTSKDVPTFFKGLIKYVLMPILFIITLVIYGYIFKILLKWKIPSNEAFGIFTFTFIFGLIVWTLMQYFEKDGFLYKASRIIPYLFIPFIIVQTLSISIRINGYGFTPSRYCGIMVIVFEICYLLLYIISYKKIYNILLVAIALILISLIVPFINMFDVSYNSQLQVIKQYKSNPGSVSTEKAYGAYYYLKDKDKFKEYSENNLTDEDIENLTKSVIGSETYNDKYKRKNYNIQGTEDVDISGYNKIQSVNSYLHYFKKEENINSIPLYDENHNYIRDVDLTETVNDIIENNNNYNNTQIIIDLNENTRLILVEFDFTVYEDSNLMNLSLKGYLLTK